MHSVVGWKKTIVNSLERTSAKAPRTCSKQVAKASHPAVWYESHRATSGYFGAFGTTTRRQHLQHLRPRAFQGFRHSFYLIYMTNHVNESEVWTQTLWKNIRNADATILKLLKMAGRHGGVGRPMDRHNFPVLPSVVRDWGNEVCWLPANGVALMPQSVLETHIGLTLWEVSIPEVWLHAKCYDITLHLTIPSFLAQV